MCVIHFAFSLLHSRKIISPNIISLILNSPQVCIILTQQLRPEVKARFNWFFRLSDILILLHFMLDPYIYVLLRQSGRSDLRTMIRYVFSRNQFNIVETAMAPIQKTTNSSPLP